MARRRERDSGGSPEWMTTYSDMVTLPLCFFIMLFAMSTLDKATFYEMAESLAMHGVVGFLPTIPASSIEETKISLESMKKVMEDKSFSGAKIIGALCIPICIHPNLQIRENI